MSVLVTGAGGYLASGLVPLLAQTQPVVAFTRGSQPAHAGDEAAFPVVWRRGNLSDRRDVRGALAGVETIVHLAGLKGTAACSRDLRATVEANLVATSVLLEEARAAGARKVLFTSSYSVYGRRADVELPCTEDDELRPYEPYGMSKALAERLVEQSTLDYAIIRLSNVFGWGSGDLVEAMIASARQRSMVEVHGDGTHTLDLIPRDQACQAIQRLLAHPSAHRLIVNVGSGRAMPVAVVAQAVAQACRDQWNLAVAVRHVPVPSEPQFSKAIAVERLRTLVGSWPVRSLDQVLRELLRRSELPLAGLVTP